MHQSPLSLLSVGMPKPKRASEAAAARDQDELEVAQGAALLEEAMASFRSPPKQPEAEVKAALPTVSESSRDPPNTLTVAPTGRWDDGAKCMDQGGGLLLWCAKCGNRPRPEHEFRCRLHDEELSNADERPMFPGNLDDKMKMRRYKKDMDEWQPEWLERDDDDDEPPPVGEAEAYPCHCPACEGKTVRYGVAGTEFATSTRILVSLTEWLTESYKYAASAPEAVSERRFMAATGMFGHCVKCNLLVQATVETHNENQYL